MITAIRRLALAMLLFLGLALASMTYSAERTNFPPSARAEYERGQELLKKGRYRDALDAFEEAIRKGMKEFPRVHLAHAKSSLGLKDYDAAISRYTSFIDDFGLEDSCRH